MITWTGWFLVFTFAVSHIRELLNSLSLRLDGEACSDLFCGEIPHLASSSSVLINVVLFISKTLVLIPVVRSDLFYGEFPHLAG